MMTPQELQNLVTEIARIAPQNNIELLSDGIRLNSVDIKIEGNLVYYRSIKAPFRNVHSFLENLRFEGILKCSKTDIFYLSIKCKITIN
jgi:hypothetical protein